MCMACALKAACAYECVFWALRGLYVCVRLVRSKRLVRMNTASRFLQHISDSFDIAIICA